MDKEQPEHLPHPREGCLSTPLHPEMDLGASYSPELLTMHSWNPWPCSLSSAQALCGDFGFRWGLCL